ncbi:hypothetical protein C8P63_102141 [Melghirimyces profundicolus]|uniref:Uncharacterized protein n=1 Tax=Melghirimyces profundicolus TaxID=1242148 RepID=A0A2T6C8K5_9BACL|nr:hypothetical protein [Melghirimyces profundicolus]PTX64647.1 hypothetical protein C8P63_102141 [Melghirimyces profundicolus]
MKDRELVETVVRMVVEKMKRMELERTENGTSTTRARVIDYLPGDKNNRSG